MSRPCMAKSLLPVMVLLVFRPAVAAEWPDFAGLHQDYIRQYAQDMSALAETVGTSAVCCGGPYAMSYFLNSMAYAASATGDVDEMATLVGFVRTMIAGATPNGFGHTTWTPRDDTYHLPEMLSSFKGMEGMAKVAKVIMANPTF